MSSKNLGEQYKELRLGRKVKQKDVASKFLSTAQLSKFESGHSMLSADKMIRAIDGIHMTFAEFGYALNDYQPTEQQKLSDKIISLTYRRDRESLLALLEKHQVSNTVFDRLNVLLIKNAIRQLDDNYTLSQEEGEFLTEYLYSIENWTSYELYLFGNTLHFLSDLDLLFLSKELVARANLYIRLKNYRSTLKHIYLNIISELLERKKVQHLDFFISELKKLLDIFDTFDTIVLGFMELVYASVTEGIIKKEKLETYIQHVSDLGLDSLKEILNRKLSQYEDIYFTENE